MVEISNKTFDEIAIGQHASLQRTLTTDDIAMFSAMSGDTNPAHYDAEHTSRRHRITGHSMWGVSLISALLGNDLPGAGTVYKRQDISFRSTVEVGDTLTVAITATGKDPADHSVAFDCRAVNQRGETVFTGTAEVVAPVERRRTPRVEVPEMRLARHHHVFEDMIARCHDRVPVKTAVCHPCDEVSLRGAVEAAEAELIEPILVGPTERIQDVAGQCGLTISGMRIEATEHSHDSAARAVALCRSGEAHALMKGSLHTDEMMHEVTDARTGLRTARRLSHVFIMDVPTYPRMLLVTDAAVNIAPDLEAKIDIVQNAIDLARVLGVDEPRVAILSAVETVTPKIASTLDAAALCKMADRGQITRGVLDGPLAFDNAISEEAARIKKIASRVAGRPDILMVPDLEAGNILAKQLAYLANADAAGIVLGARVPIVLTSRADSAKARLASCAVAVLCADHGPLPKE